MELSRLLHSGVRAKRWKQAAVQRLAAGDREGAEAAVANLLALQRRPLALVLRAFIRQGG